MERISESEAEKAFAHYLESPQYLDDLWDAYWSYAKSYTKTILEESRLGQLFEVSAIRGCNVADKIHSRVISLMEYIRNESIAGALPADIDSEFWGLLSDLVGDEVMDNWWDDEKSGEHRYPTRDDF